MPERVFSMDVVGRVMVCTSKRASLALIKFTQGLINLLPITMDSDPVRLNVFPDQGAGTGVLNGRSRARHGHRDRRKAQPP